jgi:U4/U6 small nuclear ribonucleoprotein PRP31
VVMAVTVTGSTTQTGPLSKEDLTRVFEGCDEAEYLASCKTRILAFIESRMALLAPNISAILGTTIAAKLLVLAGGLSALAGMPACNIQVLGQKKKLVLGGFSAMAALPHTGHVYYCPIVQSAPSHLRMKAAGVTANKYVCRDRPDAIGSTHPLALTTSLTVTRELPWQCSAGSPRSAGS